VAHTFEWSVSALGVAVMLYVVVVLDLCTCSTIFLTSSTSMWMVVGISVWQTVVVFVPDCVSRDAASGENIFDVADWNAVWQIIHSLYTSGQWWLLA
jgi:hypothetical protein